MSTDYRVTDSRTADKFVLRLPDGLRGDISTWAQSNDRSMNSEIVNRLKRSVTQDQLTEEQARMIAILLQRVDELEAQVNPVQEVA